MSNTITDVRYWASNHRTDHEVAEPDGEPADDDNEDDTQDDTVKNDEVEAYMEVAWTQL